MFDTLRLKDASSCIRILAHLVDELQQQRDFVCSLAALRSDTVSIRDILGRVGSRWDKEIVMCYYAVRIAALVLLLFTLCVVIAAQTPSAAINHYKDGLSKTKKGDHDGAIRDYTKAIELSSRLYSGSSSRSSSGGIEFNDDSESSDITVVDPFTANAYSNRGVARLRKGDLEGAIRDFNQALRIRPGLAEAYLNRGSAKRRQGDLEGALADVNRAISLKKNLVEAYNNRGALRHDLGDLEGALSDLNRAIELKSEVPAHFFHRGYVYIKKREYNKAIADFDRTIQLNPSIAQAYQGRGVALMSKGQYDRAITDFNQALNLNPNLALSYMNRGLALMMRGRDSEAQKDFEKGMALDPELELEIQQRKALAEELRKSNLNY